MTIYGSGHRWNPGKIIIKLGWLSQYYSFQGTWAGAGRDCMTWEDIECLPVSIFPNWPNPYWAENCDPAGAVITVTRTGL